MRAPFLNLRNVVATGLLACLTWLAIAVPPASAAESGTAGPVPEIVLTEGLVNYRTNNALLPLFVEMLAQAAGLDLQGVELLEQTQLSYNEGLDSVPELVARLLHGYNYVLAFTADQAAGNERLGTLIIAGPRGLERRDPAHESAASPVPEILEVGEGRVRSEAGFPAAPTPVAGQRYDVSEPPKSAPSDAQAKAQPAQLTVGSLLENQLSSFGTPSRQSHGMGPMFGPAGISQPAGIPSNAAANAQAGGTGNSVDLQEATRRALLSVQEMARALEAASVQLSQQKK